MSKKATYEELLKKIGELEKQVATLTQLNEISNLLSLSVEQSREGIAVVDLDGNLKFLNDAFARMHGYVADEIVGKHLSIFHTPEQIPSVELAIKRLKQDGVFKGEIWHAKRDGTVFPTIMHNSLIRDETHKPIGMLGTIRDISNLKAAEDALKKSEREKAAILDAMSELVAYQDKNHTVLWTNRAAAASVNEEKISLIGKKCYEIWAKREEECKNCPVAIAVETGNVHRDRNRTPDGRIWEITGYPVKNEMDEVVGAVEVTAEITQVEKAENALRESEERFRALVESAPVSILLLQNGKFIYSNHTGAQFLGYSTPESLIGLEGLSIVAPEFKDAVSDRIKQIENGKDNPPIEVKMIKKNGEPIWLLSASVHVKMDGIPTAIIVGQNITERKQAEDLKRAQRNLSIELSTVKNFDEGLGLCVDTALLVSGMDCGGIYLLDKISGGLDLVFHRGLPKQFVTSTSHFEADSAHTKLVMMGKPIYTQHQRLGVPIDDDKKGESLKAIAVIPIIHQNQVIGCLNVASHTINEVPVFSRDTLETIAIKIGSAIIHLKTKEALRKSEERFRELAELLPETIFEVDATGNITFVNRKAFEHFRYTQQDFDQGLNALDMIVPEDRSRAMENITEIFEGKDIGLSEYKALRKDGTTFPAFFHSSVILHEGKPAGLRGFIIDISEKKRIEAQLLQAQKMDSIGNLAGGIAHDFNNILSSIIGFTELAFEETPKGTVLEDSLQEVYSAGKRAKDLVRHILAFARQSDEKRSPIQPCNIAREVLNFIRSTIPTTIEIQRNIESESFIIANATQVHQVLMNLCTNAANAMEDSGGVLRVSLKDQFLDKKDLLIGLKPGDYVEIKVSDTGVGIAPDIIESIFEPYFTTKGPGEGTGMGLAMVQGVIESYGGKITVESQLGKGSTFSIYLPVTKKQSAQSACVSETLPIGTERILFVDDEYPIAKMGGQILERLGYSVTTRTSSIEALELLRSKPNDFDLVVTDMTMPNMTGDKLAVELMKIRSDILVILCTGYSKKVSDESANEIGIKAFAYKPIVKADLAKTVRKVLDEAKG